MGTKVVLAHGLQEKTAENIGAKVTRVDGSHVSMLSHPQAVADSIIDASEHAPQTPQ